MLKLSETERRSIECTDGEEKTELEKVAMIQMSNAIVDPRTMVILIQNTPSTDGTVMSTRWFGKDALSTDIGRAAAGRWYIRCRRRL